MVEELCLVLPSCGYLMGIGMLGLFSKRKIMQRLNCTVFITWIYRDVLLCCLTLFTPRLFAPPSIQPCKTNHVSAGNRGKLVFKESQSGFIALLMSNKTQVTAHLFCKRLFAQGKGC